MARVNNFVIVLVIIISTLTTAHAAEINKNRNLQLHEAGTVSAYALGGSAGVGGRLDFNSNFGTTRLIWGASAEVMSSKDFGSMSSAGLTFGYKIGGKFAFTPSVLAGYGQYGMMQDFTNGANASYYKTTTPWTPFVGGELKVSVVLGGRVDVSILGGYKYNFQQASSDAVPAGWTELPRTHNNRNWYVGAGLAFDLNKDVVQGGGDRTFYSGGFAIIDNAGLGGGVELGHFGSRHAKHGLEKGVRSTWVSNSGYTENEISAFFGYRWLPWGAQSPLSASFGAQVGIGNLACAFKAATEEGEFSHVQPVLGVFGGSAGLYGKLALRISRRFELVAGAYAKGVLANKFEAGGDKGMAVVEYTRPDVFRYGATIGLGFYF